MIGKIKRLIRRRTPSGPNDGSTSTHSDKQQDPDWEKMLWDLVSTGISVKLKRGEELSETQQAIYDRYLEWKSNDTNQPERSDRLD